MPTASEILKAALTAPPRDVLAEYKESIVALREKNYTWREVAAFLQERGIDTDHSKVFRFMQRYGNGSGEKPDMGFHVPHAAQYETALRTLDMSDEQRLMLGFHYKAHNRTVNFTQLARAAGQSTYRYANTVYGRLGRKLGEAIGMQFVQANGSPFYSSAIGADNPYRENKSDFQLIMHHELAKAITALGWFDL